jgi:septum formation protein
MDRYATDPARTAPRLVLASTSQYRRELLARLQLPYTAAAPDCDETPLPGESPGALVTRLAEGKARSLARGHPDTLIVGADQVGVCDGVMLTKPGSHERAVAQLRMLSGRRVQFQTGLCLLNAATGHCQVAVEHFQVDVRTLTQEAIEDYLGREQPYDCAGAFRAEGLGIALFRSMAGSDPNTLIGLPLIRLVDFLAVEGVSVLGR